MLQHLGFDLLKVFRMKEFHKTVLNIPVFHTMVFHSLVFRMKEFHKKGCYMNLRVSDTDMSSENSKIQVMDKYNFLPVYNMLRVSDTCILIPVLDNHKLRRVLGMRSSRNWVMGIGMEFDMTLMGLDSLGLDSYNLVSCSLATDRCN